MKQVLKISAVLAVVAVAAAVASVQLAGQAAAQGAGRAGAPPAAPTPGAAVPPAGRGRGGAQSGVPPVKVLFISKGHEFDRQGLLGFFDGLNQQGITYTQVEQPAAQVFYDQKNAAAFDVLVFYDAPGRVGPDGRPVDPAKPVFQDASPEAKLAFAQMLMAGKPLVFFHHSIAAWTHTWPEYQEVVGGACDWNNEIDYRGVHYSRSGAAGGTKQHITVVDKTSPIVAGLGDGYDITDEAYSCPYAADKTDKNTHVLLTTDFVPRPPATATPLAKYKGPVGKYSNAVAWYKSAENSPVVWIQHGHSAPAWADPNFTKLMVNAIKWAASPEAKAWAQKNPTKIFKNVKPLAAPAKSK